MSQEQNPQLLNSIVQQFLNEGKRFLVLTAQAIVSLAWLWPLRGIYFSISNPSVIMSVRAALMKALLTSAIIFGALAFFTYIPQMGVLALFSGPLAPILALFLVGAESALVVAFFARPLFLDLALSHVFDATLRARGQGELVKTGKTRTPSAARGAASNVESALVKPLQALSRDGLVRYLVTLPLNFVPIAGTVLFVMYNGYRGGPSWHSRYFQLKGFSKNQRAAFVRRKQGEYAAFGTVTLLCTFIPFVGLLFSFTNTVGAAMWAAHLEAQANLIDTPTQSRLTEMTGQTVEQAETTKEQPIKSSGPRAQISGTKSK
ncbi:uncharacterized protein FIBRA_03408 [Fibroporia radiculosa]|uniref:Outer spore wall protein RRT8 n=1 Tax=Fibroporia radiculosa TaxID=599839 RepID=J4G5C9_9APHY|nr:uncharacterized protein FIBRA_03408 [Fibroporia radiculosa]CCM01358.1 predicted protein [Fibroporia radiculosa]